MLKSFKFKKKVNCSMETGFAHLISLSFLSRMHSSLQHGLWAEDKWRCVRPVYQSPKSSLNLTFIPQISCRLFSCDVCYLAWTGAVIQMLRHLYSLNGGTINSMTALMSSMSASNRMTISLDALRSLDGSVSCNTGYFSLMGWEALLFLLIQKKIIGFLMLINPLILVTYSLHIP